MFQITEIQLALLDVCINGGGGFVMALPDLRTQDKESFDELVTANTQADDLVDEDLLFNKGVATINGQPSRVFAVTLLGRNMFSDGQSAGTAKSVN